MKNYLEELKEKIQNNIKLENIEIVDNSYLHKGHKFLVLKISLALKNQIYISSVFI